MSTSDRPKSFAAALAATDEARLVAPALRRWVVPGSAALIAVLALARWAGEQAGAYPSWFGTLLFAGIVIAGFSALLLVGARAVEGIDRGRREAADGYRRLVEQLPLVVYVDELSNNSANIYTSCQTEKLLGYTVEEWVDNPDLFVECLHPDDRERVLREVAETNASGEPFCCEYRLIAKDGRVVWVRDEASLFRDEHGTAVHSQGYLLDITDRREAEQQVRELAWTDALTQLPNRARLTVELEEIAGGDRDAALLFLDLDDFKTVNDSLGHLAGDEYLAEIARRIRASVRPDDLVARLGGDEFAILISPAAGDDVHESVARRILDALARPYVLQGHELRPRASIGVASGRDGKTILREADLALYDAKASRIGIALFRPALYEVVRARLALLAELRSPDLHEQLVLHYQPTYDLSSGRVEGVEALVRWQNPLRGLVAPADFIPLAEEGGAIVAIGRWVLRTACAEVVRWRAESTPALTLAVNVSGLQLQDPGFADEIRTILQESGLPAEALRLELTEGVLADAGAEARQNLSALVAGGVQLALDDFGTGHAWIDHLRQFPFAIIKLDRSFLGARDDGGSGPPILPAIVALARELDLAVVAEGIEQPEQLEAVRRLNCSIGQGFHLARPATAEAVGELLRAPLDTPAPRLRLA
ncbi:MAG TPA: EAL domain-containing protein [Gaiellaceae bacterium]|nr:EAL domain-containing protein [Gaiellaceae bacterium]